VRGGVGLRHPDAAADGGGGRGRAGLRHVDAGASDLTVRRLAGAPGIAVGNVVGSNIANILLILGVAAVIAAVPGETATPRTGCGCWRRPCSGSRSSVLSPVLGRVQGAILAGRACLYIWRALSREGAAAPGPGIEAMPGWRIAALILIGLGALMAGAWLLVTGPPGSRARSA
jgi:cation:H+ antiporter